MFQYLARDPNPGPLELPKEYKVTLHEVIIFRRLRPLTHQFFMFAILNIGGFQEMVKEGDTLEVPLMDAEKGKKVTLGDVLFVSKDGGDVVIGAPFVKGASVELKVLDHGRDDKIRVYRMRRRKRFQKSRGHRQDFTAVEVVKISL